MQAKLRCAKYMYATTMVTKSGMTMVAPVAPLPTALIYISVTSVTYGGHFVSVAILMSLVQWRHPNCILIIGAYQRTN